VEDGEISEEEEDGVTDFGGQFKDGYVGRNVRLLRGLSLDVSDDVFVDDDLETVESDG
jgi:hypothetical protein